jgi:carbonic anhydrase
MKFPPRLIDGYHAFTATRLPLERSRFQKLAETGQQPEVMVICCCDSRVSPEVIFDAHPGELFVVRNIANLVPPYSPSELRGVSAALEFAVQDLKVKYIIVMGHSHCGGVRAFVEHRGRPNPGDFRQMDVVDHTSGPIVGRWQEHEPRLPHTPGACVHRRHPGQFDVISLG